MTFDGIDADGTVTKGGYSSYIVVHERYLKVSHSNWQRLCCVQDDEAQDQSPWEIIGRGWTWRSWTLGARVSKKDEALDLLGADKFIISSDEQQMTELARSFDFIINTASGSISFDLYLSLLKANGTKTVTGALPGGVKHTQELLDFCGAHKIYPDIEMIPIQYANEALGRLIKKDVKHRYCKFTQMSRGSRFYM
ncbi:hypothetical protein Leryth_011238 [Lithospermum erythrorhizon]|nr:hypothetical protein Leryth_011238 [Lithospermum erythrorhizon]